MNDFLQERKSLVILIIVILFLLLGLAYFYWIMPMKDEANAAKTNVELLESDIQILQSQLDNLESDQTDIVENQFVLERKMPLDRSIDDLILSLQEIEFVSGTRIENISFNNYDVGLTEADQVFENEEVETEEETSRDELLEDTETENLEEPTEPPVSDVVEDLPANVKLITINLSVISPNFEQFEVFLQEVEKLERITRVDTLSFSQPGEQELLNLDGEVADTTVTIEVQLTTFYYDENKTNTEE